MSDVLSRLTQRPGARPFHEDPDADEKPSERHYQAMVVEPTNKRTPAKLKVMTGKGEVSLLSYAFLSEVLIADPQHLALFYTHCVIEIRGEHLDQLIERLQEDKVRALICFNPQRHDAVAQGQPVITSIVRRSRGEQKPMPGQSPERLQEVEHGRR